MIVLLFEKPHVHIKVKKWELVAIWRVVTRLFFCKYHGRGGYKREERRDRIKKKKVIESTFSWQGPKDRKLGVHVIRNHLCGGVVVYWCIHWTLTLRARVRIPPSPRHFNFDLYSA